MKFPRATRRLLAGYLVFHLIAATILVLLLTALIRNQMVGEARKKLTSMATMLAEQLESQDKSDETAGVSFPLVDIGRNTGLHFSLLSENGTVIADSVEGESKLEPAETGEIAAARTQTFGFSERQSGLFEQPVLYVAKAVSSDSDVAFVRVGKPMSSITDSVTLIRNYLWLFAIGLGAITAGLVTWLSSNYMRPLGLFSKAARRVGKGKYEAVPAVHHRGDEWAELGDEFEKMQERLRQRETRLFENSQRLEAVLSSMIEGVLAIHPNGDVMLANGAACRMLSFHREKLVGRKLTEVVRIPELTQAIETSQRERTFSKTEFKTLGDATRTLKARVSMLADEDEPGLAVVLHDVTELRQLETMRQDFVANVSHELKTPLASIKAYAETLRMGAIKDEDKNVQFLEQIEFQADTLNQQIQDLLQLARVESGEKTFSISDIDVNLICESLHRQFLDSALGRHLELHLQLAQPSPLARCDADAIETVVKNLVVNAIHYTPEGGRVSISTSVDGNWVVISVTDTGIGIAPEQQARVFERFYRVDKARSRDMGGTGLGLAIVKHLTQAFGGNVTLESQLGKGSKFHVRLPKSK